MEPKFKNNSKVLVSSIPYVFSKPKIGDVVAFHYSIKILIKRIKKIENSKYFLEGDNLGDSLKTKSIDRTDIIGQIIYSI